MDFLKSLFVVLAFQLTACQLPYYVKSSYNQLSLLSSRVPIEKALLDPNLSEDDKRKLRLSQKARDFSEKVLHLKSDKNYTSFVKLDRPYVTYVVNASAKWELKHYMWSYLFVGEMPYKGFFNEKEAQAEEEELKKNNLDTYLRGVSAYSTLGWFKDPLLSSMLRYKDYDLVNTIIHESVHATLYIKNNADFNERMAVFLGGEGTELFYLQEEGPDSQTLKLIKEENEDEKVFSLFISKEIKEIELWYKNQKEKNDDLRQKRIDEINEHFVAEIEPKLKTKIYQNFPKTKLNNARLLLYKTYQQDLSEFEKIYETSGKDFAQFLKLCEEHAAQIAKNLQKK